MVGAVKVGPWGAPGGNPCDINNQSKPQRLESITVFSSEYPRGLIYGFSFVYVDEQGQPIAAGPWGSAYSGTEFSKTIKMGPGEHLIHVSGTADDSDITSLKLVTNLSEYGCYGCPAGAPFSLQLKNEKGEVVAFFGRSGDTLKALGVYVLGMKGSLVKLGLCASSSGEPWDIDLSNKPDQLSSITVYSTQCNRGRIYYFSFTYLDQNGKSIHVPPMPVRPTVRNEFLEMPRTFTMKPGEYINKITGTADDHGLTSLTFTTNQNEYSQLGSPAGTAFSVPLPGNRDDNGAVVAFFGRSGENLTALGAYVGLAPKPEP